MFTSDHKIVRFLFVKGYEKTKNFMQSAFILFAFNIKCI